MIEESIISFRKLGHSVELWFADSGGVSALVVAAGGILVAERCSVEQPYNTIDMHDCSLWSLSLCLCDRLCLGLVSGLTLSLLSSFLFSLILFLLCVLSTAPHCRPV